MIKQVIFANLHYVMGLGNLFFFFRNLEKQPLNILFTLSSWYILEIAKYTTPLYNPIVGVKTDISNSYPICVIMRANCIIKKSSLDHHLGSNNDPTFIQNHVIKRSRCRRDSLTSITWKSDSKESEWFVSEMPKCKDLTTVILDCGSGNTNLYLGEFPFLNNSSNLDHNKRMLFAFILNWKLATIMFKHWCNIFLISQL